MFDAALLVFLRWPEVGRVKTRLAAAAGAETACAIYRDLAGKAVAVARSAAVRQWAVTLLTTGAPAERFVNWLGTDLTLRDQVEGGLGERLRAGFAQAFAGGADLAVAIGGDCPELTLRHLERARRILAEEEVVLGPARDGGYYLIGCRRGITGIFARIDWGTASVLEQTRQRCRSRGYSVGVLEELRDVDTVADAVACGLIPAPAPAAAANRPEGSSGEGRKARG